MAKFEKEFKTFSNTKKKDLADSIKTAKDIYENKKGPEEKIKSKDKKNNNNNQKESSSDGLSKNNNDKIEKGAKNNHGSISNTPLLPLEQNKNIKKENVPLVSNDKKGYPQDVNNIQSTTNTNNSGNISFLKKKTKRIDEKNGIELIHKIISYISKIVKLLSQKSYEKIEEDKECMLKVLTYLKDYKMSEPIDFLKVYN